jgi:hypothetical protein
MHFVDNIDFESRPRRVKDNVFTKLPNFINSIVGSSVNLNNIDIFAEIYLNAAFTLTARLSGWGVAGKAIERFGQNASHSRFADASGADKQIRVSDFTGFYGVFERLRNGLLPDDVIERLRPVFSG